MTEGRQEDGPRAVSPLLEALRRANRATRHHRRLRRAAVGVYSTVVRAHRFLPPPRVVLNGPAKSGTHLLSDCLSLLPKMMFSGRHFTPADFARADLVGPTPSAEHRRTPPLDLPRLRRYLDRCPDGMFVTTHAGHQPDLRAVFVDLGLRHVLLLRDPRDVAVSLAHFLRQSSWLPRHDHFARVLDSDEARLMAVIEGYDDGAGGFMPGIGAVLETFLPWLEAEEVLVCRFEELVGERGGGSAAAQIDAIVKLAAFVGRPLSAEQAASVAGGMYSRRGLTFRSGQIGDWRRHFGDDHVAAFKRCCSHHLVRFGYEAAEDW